MGECVWEREGVGESVGERVWESVWEGECVWE